MSQKTVMQEARDASLLLDEAGRKIGAAVAEIETRCASLFGTGRQLLSWDGTQLVLWNGTNVIVARLTSDQMANRVDCCPLRVRCDVVALAGDDLFGKAAATGAGELEATQ